MHYITRHAFKNARVFVTSILPWSGVQEKYGFTMFFEETGLWESNMIYFGKTVHCFFRAHHGHELLPSVTPVTHLSVMYAC